jgi:hypothetical protein
VEIFSTQFRPILGGAPITVATAAAALLRHLLLIDLLYAFQASDELVSGSAQTRLYKVNANVPVRKMLNALHGMKPPDLILIGAGSVLAFLCRLCNSRREK